MLLAPGEEFELVEVDGLIEGSIDLERAVRAADVVVTGTHARGWIVDDAWIEPGTHIAALGADLEGEQELHPAIPQRGIALQDSATVPLEYERAVAQARASRRR